MILLEEYKYLFIGFFNFLGKKRVDLLKVLVGFRILLWFLRRLCFVFLLLIFGLWIKGY